MSASSASSESGSPRTPMLEPVSSPVFAEAEAFTPPRRIPGIRGMLAAAQHDDVGACVEAARELEGSVAGAADHDGWTPLHVAARNGCLRVAAWLLKQGVPIDVSNKHAYTPLHDAAGAGQVAMVRLLLARGADANRQDVRQFTPLTWAIRDGHKHVVTLLLDEWGVCVTLVDDEGESPLHWCCYRGEPLLACLLLARGATPQASHSGDMPQDLSSKPHLWLALFLACAEVPPLQLWLWAVGRSYVGVPAAPLDADLPPFIHAVQRLPTALPAMRFSVLEGMATLWKRHHGATTDDMSPLVRCLALRRFCRVRGDTEVVEPFAADIAMFT